MKLPKHKLFAAAVVLLTPPLTTHADQPLLNLDASFSSQNQSIWGSGDAFIWDFNQFVGPDFNNFNNPIVVNPRNISFGGGYAADPYFQFFADFKAGLELGANVNGGSINTNLDYNLSLNAPEVIKIGESFSINPNAQKLASSSFQTTAANASAYLDAVLETRIGAYTRIVVDRPVIASQDLRFGNRGYTNGATNNNPYNILTNIREREEIISINRNQSGVIRYLGGQDLGDGDLLYDQIGSGDSVNFGPVSLTAGNFNPNVTASGSATSLNGDANVTVVTATLDVDQLIVGSPVLGQRTSNDWGIIDYELGYDIVDFKANLDVGLMQSFNLAEELSVNLKFSENVLLEGIGETDFYTGLFGEIPDITLLTDMVDVDTTFLVNVSLQNETDVTFGGSLDLSIFSAVAKIGYDIPLDGQGRRIASNVDVCAYCRSDPFDLGDINVFNGVFALEGFEEISGGRFTLSAVPVPAAVWLFAPAFLTLLGFARR
jgi:hypothetical protein